MKNEHTWLVAILIAVGVFLLWSIFGGMWSGGYGYYMPMMGYGYNMMSGYGFPVFSFIIQVLIIVLLALVIAWLVKQVRK